MPYTAEELNVKFSALGDAAVVNAFGRLGVASKQARTVVGEELEGISVVTERVGRRLEHFGIQSAFLFSSMAEGGEQGLTRFGHSLAGFGFLFGPLVGTVTTAAALITERIIEMFHKTTEEAKKAREEFEKEIDKLGNAAESKRLQEQLRVLERGEPLKGGIRASMSQFAPGAVVGSLADLRANAAALDDAQKRLEKMYGFAARLTDAWRINAREIELLKKPLEDAERRARDLTAAILNVQNQPAEMGGVLPTMKSTTNRDFKGLISEMGKEAVDFTGAMVGPYGMKARIDKVRQELTASIARMAGEMDTKDVQLLEEGRKKLAEIVVKPIIPPGKMGEHMRQQEVEFAEQAKRLIALADKVSTQVTQTIAHSLTAGFESLFSGGGVKGAFRALTGAVLEGLGSMFEEIGISVLAGMALMAKIKAAILSFAPEIGIPVALGLIALGAAMKAGGASLAHGGTYGGGSYSGGGAYGGGGYSGPQVAYVNPLTPVTSPSTSTAGLSARSSVIVNATFFGKDDPAAQRGLLEMIQRAQRRGSTSG